MEKNTSGFTLIEIAIVLVIIGLLAGGILKGQQMIANAKYKAFVKDVDSYRIAFHTFQDRYHYMPGDFRDAVATFTQTSNIAVKNGNGDGQIQNGSWGVNSEAVQAYVHLLLSGLIAGDPNNISMRASDNLVLAVPTASGNGNLEAIASHPYSYNNNMLRTWLFYKVSNPEVARRYDEEFDDGIANKGEIVCWVTTCSNSATWPSNVDVVMAIAMTK